MTDGFKPGGPSPEARQWLKGRKVTPAFSYKDVWQEEHSVSFTVAKAMKADVLGTLKKSLLKKADGIPGEGLPSALYSPYLSYSAIRGRRGSGRGFPPERLRRGA